MKVSLNRPRDLVELPPTVPALVDLLTLAGVETRGCAIPNVVVAQIKDSVHHPNGDPLSVCQFDDRSGTARQIVRGVAQWRRAPPGPAGTWQIRRRIASPGQGLLPH